ncbi:hypothetical protein N7486_001945 [Penicillium sp. IBT 16267x]|nr:hypothetical protein N7486_001945 [Penicillium sp. IBT 16267x]
MNQCWESKAYEQAMNQNEDDRAGLIDVFTTGQSKINKNGETDAKEGNSGGHFTNSFMIQREIQTLPKAIKALSADIAFYHEHELPSLDLCHDKDLDSPPFFEDASALCGWTDNQGLDIEFLEVTSRPARAHFLTASSLATLSRRMHQFIVGEFSDDSPPTAHYTIEIQYGPTVGITFKINMSTADHDPSHFDTSDVRGLERLAGLKLEYDANAETMSAHGEPVQPLSFKEASEVSGDIGMRCLSIMEDVPELRPLNDEPFTILHQAAYSATLCCTQTIRRSVMIGDHPSTLGQALIAGKRNVIGVDPLNDNTVVKATEYRGAYQQIAASVHVRDGTLVAVDRRGNKVPLNPDITTVVVDTSLNAESALIATHRNISIGLYAKSARHDMPVIVQLRDRPQCEVELGLLELPGHRNQGCECYRVLLMDGEVNFGRGSNDWTRYCWLRTATKAAGMADAGMQTDLLDADDDVLFQLGRDAAHAPTIFGRFFCGSVRDWARHKPPAGMRRRFPDGVSSDTYRGALRHWYQVIISRAFLQGHRSALGGGPESGILQVDNPVEALATLERNLGRYDVGRDSLNSRFEITDTRLFTDTAPGLFQRHPVVRDVVRSRYSALAAMTSFDDAATPHNVFELFRHPSSGVLLRGLSSIRRAARNPWRGVALARFRRVLPYELMSVLSYEPLYICVYNYVYALSLVVVEHEREQRGTFCLPQPPLTCCHFSCLARQAGTGVVVRQGRAANELELETQSSNVQYLLSRVNYWRAEARFHLEQRMLEINRCAVLNTQLKEYRHLEEKVEELGAEVKRLREARK